MRRRLALFLTLALAMPATAQEIRSDIYYRLSTEFLGPDVPLGLQIGGDRDEAAELEAAANVSSQFWRIQQGPNGTLRLSNLYAGSQKCLEILTEGPGANQAEMQPCRDTPGQRFRLTAEDNGIRLTNGVNGDLECLDVIAEGADRNRLTLRKCGFYASQFWTLTPTDQRAD